MPNRSFRWQRYRSELSLYSRLILSFSTCKLHEIRNDFAAKYIRGDGYEIGAQKSPLYCRNAKEVKYIDYLSKEESARKYHIPEAECVDVDIIADANNLSFLPACSASFIIANHVLEHCPNPIATLLGWLRILHFGGVLYLTLPNNKANEFDFERHPVSIDHLIDDFKRGARAENIRIDHINEHIEIIEEIDPTDSVAFRKRFDEIFNENLHPHYHVFNQKSTSEIFRYIHQNIPIKIKNSFALNNNFELLYVIEKISPDTVTLPDFESERLFNLLVFAKHFFTFLRGRISDKFFKTDKNR